MTKIEWLESLQAYELMRSNPSSKLGNVYLDRATLLSCQPKIDYIDRTEYLNFKKNSIMLKITRI